MGVTLKDIARQVGVSVATVSRALGDSAEISQDRRRQILEQARRLGYTPNGVAQQLRQSRHVPSHVVGVIVPELAHYYFSTILKGIEEVCSQRGYAMMVAQSGEADDREAAACRRLYEHRVCGIIVSQAKHSTNFEHFAALQQQGVPMVFYDRICTALDTPRVVVDDYQGARNAVEHLVQTGCRRIAYYGSERTLEIAKNRHMGYRDALLQAGLAYDEELVRICDTYAMAEKLTPQLMALEQRPDAFFCINDDTAIGTLNTCKKLGYDVPDDVAICGFTNGERAVACDPMLTTVEQRGEEVGRQAASILLDMVEKRLPQGHIERRIVKTRLVVRGTTRPPKKL
jgi:DNA-binding LacI/PurR family transcriptional regulator